jgi:hypothetical protein
VGAGARDCRDDGNRDDLGFFSTPLCFLNPTQQLCEVLFLASLEFLFFQPQKLINATRSVLSAHHGRRENTSPFKEEKKNQRQISRDADEDAYVALTKLSGVFRPSN